MGSARYFFSRGLENRFLFTLSQMILKNRLLRIVLTFAGFCFIQGLPASEDSIPPKSILFEDMPNQYFYSDPQSNTDSAARKPDTLELPAKSVKGIACDSMCKDFKKYWKKVEERDGYAALKKQVVSGHDLDSAWVPHWYLFDSTVIIWPWPILTWRPHWLQMLSP
ncbi:MAG: hypothetical protein JWO30_617 [Fibrobacteres bacterium]|nr:hypothetical protein [Fibrobacterota bacterium]